jgi:hypothetical protein
LSRVAPNAGRRAAHAVTGPSARHWAGYAWFMSLGTFLPLVTFLAGYFVHLTLVAGPLARQMYGLGIWLATFGQEPPRKSTADSKPPPDKKPFAERIRPYSPAGVLERHGKPVAMPLRALWFVLIGWWLGAIWVVLSWSVFLAPYPFLKTVQALLDELPSVMTLGYPEHGRIEATLAG